MIPSGKGLTDGKAKEMLIQQFKTKVSVHKQKDAGAKGSLKNKLASLSVEAPGWQGAKVQEYQDISELSERSQTGWIGA